MKRSFNKTSVNFRSKLIRILRAMTSDIHYHDKMCKPDNPFNRPATIWDRCHELFYLVYDKRCSPNGDHLGWKPTKFIRETMGKNIDKIRIALPKSHGYGAETYKNPGCIEIIMKSVERADDIIATLGDGGFFKKVPGKANAVYCLWGGYDRPRSYEYVEW